MNFYETYYLRYLQADTDTRRQSRDHWLNVHKANMATGRDDLTIFSAQILARITLADEYLKHHVV